MLSKTAPLIALLLIVAVSACAPNTMSQRAAAQPQPVVTVPALISPTAEPPAIVITDPLPASASTPLPTVAPTVTPTEATMPTETPMPADGPPATDLILYDFMTDATTGRWYIVNDSVMGGVSESAAALAAPGMLVFSGTVSLDNFGGFASIRAEPKTFETAGATALRLRVLGDGQIYHLQVRTDSRIDGIAYDQPFETTGGEWREVVLPIADFVPQFRGRVLRNEPALDAAAIRSIGVVISDKQEGPFELQIDWITAVPGDQTASIR